jgi:regulator of protease activity HflC (stomatin/prohibitin superfamily)
MFDKLFDLLIVIWNDLWMFKIVRENERAIRLRFGKKNKHFGAGLVFKYPFIDEILVQYVCDDTVLLPSQKLTTKDGKSITITGVVLYSVEDVEPFVLNASVPTQTISDVAQGAISETIIGMNYPQIIESLEKLSNEISKDVRRECKHWGVKIHYVRLTDITLSRSFNVFKNSDSHL